MQMNQQLSDQVNRLSDEVERLRDEQESRQAAPDPPVRATKPSAPDQPTVLAFRDGHTEEVKNYAIIGSTLWVLNAERAKKVAVADLDIPTTTKLNDERGVEFALPE